MGLELDFPDLEYHYLPENTQKELIIIAKTLMVKGKGILAADESVPSIEKKFQNLNIENTEENRRLYRQLLFSTENLSGYISGVIFFHETILQKHDTQDSVFVDMLRERRIVPGVKVDKGVVPLYGTDDECTTQGLDDLGPRCEFYKKCGCHFAKWRCVLKIGQNTPSESAIQENAYVLARFASICQAYRMVPIVEPEVLPDGSHNILRCQNVTERVLAAVFKALADQRVFLEGVILKVNMVTQGQSYDTKASPEEVAGATLLTLQRTVPPSVAGIAFLSGGQSEEDATVNLNAINAMDKKKVWPLTFSFGRALQASVMKVWGGIPENVPEAQEKLLERAKANSEASKGEYVNKTEERRTSTVEQDLYIAENNY